jgi:hypothetical protein
VVKALARAFRWRKMLDEGVHATLEDLARTKDVHATYVSRVLRLTLLAPEIVEAILDGRQPAGLQLDDLLEGFPLERGARGQAARVSSGPTPTMHEHGARRRVSPEVGEPRRARDPPIDDGDGLQSLHPVSDDDPARSRSALRPSTPCDGGAGPRHPSRHPYQPRVGRGSHRGSPGTRAGR